MIFASKNFDTVSICHVVELTIVLCAVLSVSDALSSIAGILSKTIALVAWLAS